MRIGRRRGCGMPGHSVAAEYRVLDRLDLLAGAMERAWAPQTRPGGSRRWSQMSETLPAPGSGPPTQIFNGSGESVADLTDPKDEKPFL